MPAPKRTSAKIKSKKKTQFTPSRLIKTKGRFSYGKLAMIVVSFAAIGAIVISITHAFSYTDVVNWQTVAANGWYEHSNTACDANWGGCVVTLPWTGPYQIVWWGPYHNLGIPSPSGSNGQICANVRMADQGGVIFRLEVMANGGSTLLAYGNQAITAYGPSGTGWQLLCDSVHIAQPKALWPGYTNVEYRVRIVQWVPNGSPALRPELVIGQVGLFIN